MPYKYNPITNQLDLVDAAGGSGDVVGPGSSTDRAIARWDGTTGTQLFDSTVIVTDLGVVQASGLELTTPLNEIYGGTGQIGYSTGDILYADSATTLATLPIGSDGDVLTLASGLPSWAAPAPGGVTSVSGTAGRITSSGGATPIIDIDAAYVGQTSITTLGTIATGVWNGTVIDLAHGGTNANLTASVGGIFYSTAGAGAILAGTATAGQMLRSGASAAPTWSTATYPATSGTSGKVLISDGTNFVSSTPTFPNASATSGKIIISDGTNWIASTPTYPNTSGTAGKVVISDGTNNIYSTPTFPNASATSGKFIRSDGTNWIASTPTLPTSAGTAGKVLMSDATNYIESTPTYPSASGTAGKILRSDGTNNVYTTSTFADTYSASTILYSNGANTVTGLATANGGVLVTNSTGVPSIAALTNGQIIIGATAGSAIAASLTAGANITITPGANSITIAATSGGITGPGSSTDNALVRWDGAGGTTVQNGVITEDDTGNLSISASVSGASLSATVANTSNTATSTAFYNAQVAGSTASDAYYKAEISGGQAWTWGLDNSDSDAWVLSATATPGTTNVMHVATSGEINYPLQPAFLAYVNTVISNVTGDGTVYTIIYDTEVFDQNGDFNLATSTFTAPVTGRYQFNYLSRIGGGNTITVANCRLVTSNLTYQENMLRTATGSTALTCGVINLILDMDVGDTATVDVSTSDTGGKIDDVAGLVSSAAQNILSAYLVC